jgi:hypothetical protein
LGYGAGVRDRGYDVEIKDSELGIGCYIDIKVGVT